MPIRFKLDENLPRAAEDLLRQAGHDVESVLAERMGGESDTRVFDAAQAEQRVLVTLGLDFSDIRRYPPQGHHGIWVLRPDIQSIGSTVSLLGAALVVVDSEPIAARLWIIEPQRIRVRE